MFLYRRTILTIFAVLAIAFTWLVAFMVTDSWSNAFWYQMAGIWISEALLAVVVITMFGNSDRALPLHAGNVIVGILHLIYSFLLLSISSETASLLWVLGGLLVALLMHAFLGFAQRRVKDDAIAERKAFSLRNELMTALEMLEVGQREMITGNAALTKEFGKLKDAARFISDSVPGGESADEEVRAGLAGLRQCSDAEAMTRAAVDLTARIGVRENVMKRLR